MAWSYTNVPGVTKVNGGAGAIETVGRDLVGINVATLANSSVAAGQAALDAAVAAIQQIASVTVIGAFVAGTDTEVNMIIEGVETSGDAYKSAGQNTYDMTYLEKLAELTGETVTAWAF